jgi:hypothetical protein
MRQDMFFMQKVTSTRPFCRASEAPRRQLNPPAGARRSPANHEGERAELDSSSYRAPAINCRRPTVSSPPRRPSGLTAPLIS